MLTLVVFAVMAVPFAVAFVAVFLFDHRRAVLLLGVVLWLAASIYSFTTDCEGECYQFVGAFAATVALAGWGAGAWAGEHVRRRRRQRPTV